VNKRRTITVNIPAGVDNGSVLPLRGEGNCGTLGGGNGDVYIYISVKKEQLFERDGNDVYIDIPITFAQAALGDDIDVMTLEGVQKVKVSSGTQPGDTQTLRGKGIQRLNGRGKGDQIIHYTITVHKSLNSEQKKLIREMDAAIPKNSAKKGFFNH